MADQQRWCAVLAGADFLDAANFVAHVVDGAATGVGQAGEAAVLVVAVARGVALAADGAGVADHAAVLVVAVLDSAADVGDLAQAANGVGALVVDVGDCRVVVEGDGGHAVQHIVLVGRGLVFGVFARFDIAGFIVGVDGVAGIGAAGLGQVALAVDGVDRGQVARVGDLGELVQAVVDELRDAVLGVRGLGPAPSRFGARSVIQTEKSVI